jgi:hypothetical protein
MLSDELRSTRSVAKGGSVITIPVEIASRMNSFGMSGPMIDLLSGVLIVVIVSRLVNLYRKSRLKTSQWF